MKPSSNNNIPICFGESGSGICQNVTYQSTNGVFGAGYNQGGSQSYIASPPIAPNQWIHVTVTRDYTSIKLYVNGSVYTNSTTALTNSLGASYGSTPPLRAIVGARSNLTYFFNGLIDDIRTYSVVLNQNDVTALYNESCFQSYPTTSYSVCQNNSTALVALPTASNSISWYTSPTGTNAIASGSLYNTPTFTTLGTYTFFVGASNCTAYARPMITITVNPLPTVSASSGSICTGNSYTIVPSGAATYTFSGGSNVVSPLTSSSYSVTGTSIHGCAATNTAVSQVSVNITPTVSVNSGFICAGQSYTLVPSGALTYTYSGGGPVVSPAVNTSYTVTGGNNNGCYGTAVSNVGVVANPVITISGPSALCIGSSATLIASGGNIYTWNTGSNSSSIVVSPVSNTTYSVIGVNAFGCAANASKAITVNTLPVVSVNSGSICSGKVFTMTPSGAVSYTYSSGSATVAPLVNSTYTVTGSSGAGCVSAPVVSSVNVIASPVINVNSGAICIGSSFMMNPTGGISYTYSSGSAMVSPAVTTSYTVTGNNAAGCTSSAVSNVTVNPLPVITISSPGSICFGNSATLTAGGASSYTWSTGAITPAIVVSPTVNATYFAAGTNSNGCTNSAFTNVFINPLPTISVNSGSICSGKVFTIIPSGAATYTYSGGTNLVSPATTTNYSVTGTSAQGCISSNTAVSNVAVVASPTLSVNSGSICPGQTFTIIPSGATSYTYSGGSAIVSPAATTVYTITGSNASGCTGSVLATVNVNSLPNVIISGPGQICAGGNAVLNASGAATWLWNTGAVSSSISVNPVSNTTYSVTGTGANGCSKTATALVTVNPLPTISVNSGSVCSGKSFTLIPSGAATYTYSGGSNIVTPFVTTSYSVTGTSALGCVSASPAVATITVITSPGIAVNSGSICSGNSFTMVPTGGTSYTFSSGSPVVSPLSNTNYTVVGINPAGCTGTAIAGVTVNPLPNVTISGPGSVCNGSGVTLTASGANTYLWSTGAVTNTISASPAVTTVYSVTGTDLTGCSKTASANLVVNPLPVITVNSGSICAGKTFTLIPTGAATFTFTGGGPVVSPVVNTSYSVTGTSSLGCLSSNTAVSTVSVVALPLVSVTSGSICAGKVFTFSPTGAVSYTYSPGGPTVSPAATTNYSVTGSNSQGCVSLPAISTVSVIALPLISVNSGSICNGGTFTIIPSGAISYTVTGGNFVVSPASTTSYSVFGTSAAGCASTLAAVSNVTVNSIPAISVNSGSICLGKSFTITPSGASTYSYSGGSNIVSPSVTTSYSVTGTSAQGCAASGSAVSTVSVVQLPVISVNSGSICLGKSFTIVPSGAQTYTFTGGSAVVTPSVSGSYSVTGTSSLGCVSGNTAVSTVSVAPLPQINISGPSTLCSGGSISLTAAGAVSYTWNNNGSNNPQIVVSPVVNTNYTVTGADVNGCTNFTTQQVTVNQLPTITVNSGSVCNGGSFVITPSGAASYTITGGNFTVSPTVTTSYSVTGTSSAGCVSASAAVADVTVNSVPSLSISGTGSVCAGDSIVLTAAGAATYSWNTGAFTSTIGVTPAANVVYSVTGTSAAGCIDTLSHAVSVHPVPSISVSSGAICPGNSFTLNPSGAITYTYSGGSAVVSPVATSNYTVTGTNAFGCVSPTPAVATVSVVNSLTVSVTGPVTVCSGDTVILTANGASSYFWTNGPATNTILLIPVSNGDYTVMGTSGSCSSTAVHSLEVNPLPVVSVSSGSICEGESFTIVPSGAQNYTYSSGSPVVSPTITTSYSVTGTGSLGCVSLPAVADITVVPKPQLNITATRDSICAGEPVSIAASGSGDFKWDNGDTTAFIQLTPSQTAVYSVTLTGTAGCSNTAAVSVAVDECTAIRTIQEERQLITMYPNPNDGKFVVKLSTSGENATALMIFDINGRQIRDYSLTEKSMTIDTGLIPGIYFARIVSQNITVETIKIIVTH